MPRTVKLFLSKRCARCGIEFSRTRYNGVLESNFAFRRRKFCSRSCANTRTYRLTTHGYSWRARKHLKQACEACGMQMRLIAHHVDQDIANNVPENIQTLCKWCHDFWHTSAKRLGRTIAGRLPCLVLDGKADTQESQVGFPAGWTASEPSANLSSRRSRSGLDAGSSRR
jgi:hypothetical protein